MEPSSVRKEPDIALKRVLLPAPFAPIMEMNSPSYTLRFMFTKAFFSKREPGLNVLEIPFSSSIGALLLLSMDSDPVILTFLEVWA